MQHNDTSYWHHQTKSWQKNYWDGGGMSNNFVLTCLDLGIPNIEYHNISNNAVRNTSIQEWINYSVQQFTEHQKILEQSKKQQLSSYLIQCDETLRLPRLGKVKIPQEVS